VSLLSLLACAIDYAVMGFAPTVALLFVGRAIAGDRRRNLCTCQRLHRRHHAAARASVGPRTDRRGVAWASSSAQRLAAGRVNAASARRSSPPPRSLAQTASSANGAAKFHWSSAMIGIWLMTTGIGMAIVQFGAPGFVMKKLGKPREGIFGISVANCACLAYAFIPAG
jgi:hypothetical protein